MPARRFPPPWTDCAHAVADAIIVDGYRRVLMKSNVTRLDDAKALRAMGIPLNTPVEDCELSRSADRRIAAVFKSTRAFGNAVLPWAQKQTAQRLSTIVGHGRNLSARWNERCRKTKNQGQSPSP